MARTERIRSRGCYIGDLARHGKPRGPTTTAQGQMKTACLFTCPYVNAPAAQKLCRGAPEGERRWPILRWERVHAAEDEAMGAVCCDSVWERRRRRSGRRRRQMEATRTRRAAVRPESSRRPARTPGGESAIDGPSAGRAGRRSVAGPHLFWSSTTSATVALRSLPSQPAR